jgi:achaete-scute complex protein
MPESIEANRENTLSDSVEFDRKPMDILVDAPKKELASNPPVLLPATRRRRSSSARSTIKTKEPEVVARRNARERRRVKLVNDGFLRLRKHVPTDPKNKKLSKVKTLRSAIDYIRHLQQLLNQASKNSSIQLADFAKLDVLQGANGPNSWFSNLDLVRDLFLLIILIHDQSYYG